MTTITPGQLLPDGLARRLAGYYAADATGPLANLYWTGRVLPGTGYRVAALDASRIDRDSRGNRDPQAIAAELRALAHYCRHHEWRGEVPGWRDWDPDNGYDHVVPWVWRAPDERVPDGTYGDSR